MQALALSSKVTQGLSQEPKGVRSIKLELEVKAAQGELGVWSCATTRLQLSFNYSSVMSPKQSVPKGISTVLNSSCRRELQVKFQQEGVRGMPMEWSNVPCSGPLCFPVCTARGLGRQQCCSYMARLPSAK